MAHEKFFRQLVVVHFDNSFNLFTGRLYKIRD